MKIKNNLKQIQVQYRLPWPWLWQKAGVRYAAKGKLVILCAIARKAASSFRSAPVTQW